MTIAEVRVGMPLDEYLEMSNNQPFEIIDGERIPKLPTIAEHTETLNALSDELKAHVKLRNLGMVRPETTYILSGSYDANWVEGSRTPDVLFFSAARWEAYTTSTPNWRQRPYELVPDFVAEIVSPNDRVSELDKKVDAYLADGVKLIWVIDPQRRKATIYAPDQENPIVLRGDAVLDAGEVIPGFKVVLSKLFE